MVRSYADDGNYAFELYYDFQVTDNITVTPALFYLSRPFGEETGTSAKYGGLVLTHSVPLVVLSRLRLSSRT